MDIVYETGKHHVRCLEDISSKECVLRVCVYFERRVSIGEVVDDGQGLLEARASDACVCDQLTHRLDHLQRRESTSYALYCMFVRPGNYISLSIV